MREARIVKAFVLFYLVTTENEVTLNGSVKYSFTDNIIVRLQIFIVSSKCNKGVL